MEFSVQHLAELVKGDIIGDKNLKIKGVARIESAKTGELIFLRDLKFEKYLYTSKASVVIVENSFKPSQPLAITQICVMDANLAVTAILDLFNSSKSFVKRGISIFSRVSFRSKRGARCYVGAGSIISKGAKLGNDVQIYPQCYIGEDVEIGNCTIIYPGVKIYRGCKIGADCIIHSNSVIGADGFGFTQMEDGTFKKIPQIGNVIVEDNCEIGANTTIDRASIGSTIIKKGVKLDNLIQIAHNVEVGENSVIAAMVGIAGSVKVGKNCMLGGQCGVREHITIADRTMVVAQAGITNHIKEEGRTLAGSPAIDARDYFKAYAYFRKLHLQ